MSNSVLLRLALRRDRIQLTVWTTGLVLTLVSTAVSFADLYPTAAAREQLARLVSGNAGFLALYGRPPSGTVGGLVSWRLAGGIALMLGLMNLLIAVRHTRGDEESGRTELLGGTAVSRRSPVITALAVTGLADLLYAVLAFGGLLAAGLPLAGTAVFSLGTALTGWSFAGFGALAAQAARSGRGAGGLAGAVLAVSFAVRAAGDAGDSALSWVSPLGWVGLSRPYGSDRWWVLLLPLGLGTAVAGGALAWAGRRDLGSALLGERRGPRDAGAALGTPLGLAWRLHRGPTLAWVAGFGALGALFGAIAKDVGDFLKGSPQLTDLFRQLGGSGTYVDVYLASMLAFVAIVAGGYAVQGVLRLRAEETSGRAEPVLAAAVGRVGWATAHLLVVSVGTVLVLLAAGLGLGLANGLRSHDVGGQLPKSVLGALVQLPAVWLIGAVAALLVGLLPRATALGWGAVAWAMLVGWLGELLNAPSWLLDTSPFRHTPLYPLKQAAPLPLVLLTAVALLLAGVALAGYRQRDQTP